jgi:hypothetical protein
MHKRKCAANRFRISENIFAPAFGKLKATHSAQEGKNWSKNKKSYWRVELNLRRHSSA